MSERFHINWPLHPGTITLDGREAHHLAVVCRLHPGDQVTLFDGSGQEFPARIVEVTRRHVALEVAKSLTPDRELGFSLKIAAPLPKGDRCQFLVEKLTELGVTTFVPLACQRSVIHPREGKLDKLERHVIEASKQCGRNVLMSIAPLTPWTEYCGKPGKPDSVRIFAHPAKDGRPEAKAEKLPHADSYHLAVGPEGGFTDDEAARARAAGWTSLDLGPRILRVETAAIVLATRAIY